ncbi:N-glycosylase/DNA lyase [Contarinia nasturtii]|uniref:N-glycosylase/DNA lyase n=1 Tax=Contarinia nasturtii TaxID=265458 RepID=UPI0012D4B5EA|nr:N-glycosylase/DNA lyase [Contarinia nasturtii]
MLYCSKVQFFEGPISNPFFNEWLIGPFEPLANRGVKMNRNLWQKLKCTQGELQLKATLTGGQSFRWKIGSLPDDNFTDESYIGVMSNCVWQLRQMNDHLLYRVLGELKTDSPNYYHQIRMKIPIPVVKKKNVKNLFHSIDYYESLLKAYFRLDTDLSECYAEWSSAHQHFKTESNKFYAIRQLNQDPVENLFSFICSQNNHISRISSLVEKLCKNYGPKICDLNGVAYHAFPNFDELTDPKVEQELRNESFGYRAKFIQRAAVEIKERGGLEWFQKVQDMSYKDAHAELMKLTGIGPKVADCICLMSLNHLEAIPVDTHILNIATEHYLPKGREIKSMTPKLYNEIGNAFREVYGPLSGWAQTILFCADLVKFKDNESKENGCSTNKKRKKK